tara:strand:- start:3417 stop:4211 length:795 start_codon:yes stop_codon:yes gene_type:complete
MYFDEDLILDIRLNVLSENVDKFVIAEATRDHAGREKKLNFDINNFQKFKNKIEYLIIDDLPLKVSANKNNWHENHLRDQFQRNSLSRGYNNYQDEDLIMISDIDEIPNPKKISFFQPEKKYACFLQKNFQSKLNLLNTSEGNWPGTKICKKKNLKSPQWLRDIKTKQVPFWKFYKPKRPQLIEDGGWHFSFLKRPEDIITKINSYSHQEFNKPEFVNPVKIKEKIQNKKDLFGRNIVYKKVEVDKYCPNYIVKNKDKFKEWII